MFKDEARQPSTLAAMKRARRVSLVDGQVVELN
jgi:hypothetical protein